jgi:hypothetical protein
VIFFLSERLRHFYLAWEVSWFFLCPYLKPSGYRQLLSLSGEKTVSKVGRRYDKKKQVPKFPSSQDPKFPSSQVPKFLNECVETQIWSLVTDPLVLQQCSPWEHWYRESLVSLSGTSTDGSFEDSILDTRVTHRGTYIRHEDSTPWILLCSCCYILPLV